MYKQDLALNKLQELIFYKTQPPIFPGRDGLFQEIIRTFPHPSSNSLQCFNNYI